MKDVLTRGGGKGFAQADAPLHLGRFTAVIGPLLRKRSIAVAENSRMFVTVANVCASVRVDGKRTTSKQKQKHTHKHTTKRTGYEKQKMKQLLREKLVPVVFLVRVPNTRVRVRRANPTSPATVDLPAAGHTPTHPCP